MTQTYPLPARNDAVLDFLTTRRSNLAKLMGAPGPSEAELEAMLAIAARVPDHRKLAPWRFIVFEGDARAEAGSAIRDAYAAANPDHPEDRMQFEADRFLRAPTVVAVISAPVDCIRGTPVWEQELSAGAVCFNLCLAAQASGYGAQWLTEWYAYDDNATRALGIDAGERVAGFIYIGTPGQAASERVRPDVKALITRA